MERNSKPHQVEYVLVDNGSTDATYKYLTSKKPAALIRNEKNMGVSFAWNQGLRAALEINPDVICLQSNDVVAGPKWLDPVVRELSKPEKRYFIPNGHAADGTPWKHGTFEGNAQGELDGGLTGMKRGRAGWCMFFTTEAVKLFFPVPKELFLWHGDDYIHWVLQGKGYECFVLKDCCALHFVSVTFYSTPGYTEIVERDKAHFKRITAEDS